MHGDKSLEEVPCRLKNRYVVRAFRDLDALRRPLKTDAPTMPAGALLVVFR